MKSHPEAPAVYDDYDLAAIKAIAIGNASEEQQRHGMNWIIQAAAGTYQPTFVPSRPDVSNFLEGRRSVGLQLVKLINLRQTELKGSQ